MKFNGIILNAAADFAMQMREIWSVAVVINPGCKIEIPEDFYISRVLFYFHNTNYFSEKSGIASIHLK
ncbi:hypothetical protein P2W68_01780 [Chryseobacterium arthrosphaerae]|uniref:hypothetical protein n=1 Tax=Chryseobacterium arthrosphaerae TaxID=651561 RepID=UPI0023E31F5F|nr:hypothetical protein [Chryseobacterium arthrosphaerae]WES98355.1 hypothetical protein P2W68_01780 [Chryseobacterium arthrosphaerae]